MQNKRTVRMPSEHASSPVTPKVNSFPLAFYEIVIGRVSGHPCTYKFHGILSHRAEACMPGPTGQNVLHITL